MQESYKVFVDGRAKEKSGWRETAARDAHYCSLCTYTPGSEVVKKGSVADKIPIPSYKWFSSDDSDYQHHDDY